MLFVGRPKSPLKSQAHDLPPGCPCPSSNSSLYFNVVMCKNESKSTYFTGLSWIFIQITTEIPTHRICSIKDLSKIYMDVLFPFPSKISLKDQLNLRIQSPQISGIFLPYRAPSSGLVEFEIFAFAYTHTHTHP